MRRLRTFFSYRIFEQVWLQPDPQRPQHQSERTSSWLFCSRGELRTTGQEPGLHIWRDTGTEDPRRRLDIATTAGELKLARRKSTPAPPEGWPGGCGSPACPPRSPSSSAVISETAALVSESIGSDSSVADLGDAITERAAGTPYFAEEIVRDLAERGILLGRPGVYTATAKWDQPGMRGAM